MSMDKVPGLVRQLYALVKQFEEIGNGRKFTPDGHLVGSIGELYASYQFGVTLSKASTKGYDAVLGSKTIEIKTTQTNRVLFRHDDHEHVLVYQLLKDGSVQLVFNGPGALIADQLGPMNSAGQKSVSIERLRRIAKTQDHSSGLTEIRSISRVTSD